MKTHCLSSHALSSPLSRTQPLPQRPPSSRFNRSLTVKTKAGILDFLTPSVAANKKTASRAQELVNQLLELTDDTDGGIKASNSLRDQVEQLVDELDEYCPRAPLRSELIFGEWEVVYASKPTTAGGPFRSPIGRTVFPGQRAIQIISEPNVCINEVSYKALGFIPGAARQEGEITPIDEKTFQLTFPALDNKKKVGGPPLRVIETAYLDDRVRVARALPQEEGQEGSFYLFKRIVQDDIEEEEEEEEEEQQPKRNNNNKNQSKRFGTEIFSAGKKGGMATQAERAYAAKGNKKSGAATQAERFFLSKQASSSSKRGTTVKSVAAATTTTKQEAINKKKSREELIAERAAAKAALDEQRRKEREDAEIERQRLRAAAEAERAALEQRRAASREQYQESTAAAAQAASEARDAVAAFKSAEKEASALLKQAGQAKNLIEQAVAAAESAGAMLKALQREEFEAEEEVLERQRAVNELQKRLRQQANALAPRSSSVKK